LLRRSQFSGHVAKLLLAGIYPGICTRGIRHRPGHGPRTSPCRHYQPAYRSRVPGLWGWEPLSSCPSRRSACRTPWGA